MTGQVEERWTTAKTKNMLTRFSKQLAYVYDISCATRKTKLKLRDKFWIGSQNHYQISGEFLLDERNEILEFVNDTTFQSVSEINQ